MYSFSRHGPIRVSSNNTAIRKSEDLIVLRKQLQSTDSNRTLQKRKAVGLAYKTATETFCFRMPEMKKIDDGTFTISDLDEMVRALP